VTRDTQEPLNAAVQGRSKLCQTSNGFFTFLPPVILGVEPRALPVLDKCSTTELHPALAFLRQGLLCSPVWPQTHCPPALAA
jgi:hypothetical protein